MILPLKVITYNIHKGFGPGKVQFRLHEMRDALHDINADIVFLQEVQGEHIRAQKRVDSWPEAAQFEFLAEQLWPHYAYGKNAIYQSGHHGNAILSKHPIIICENINVSSVARASRGILHGVIALPNELGLLHVLCIHLGIFKSERQEQLSILTDRIAEKIPMDEPMILAGDFNDWRIEAVTHLETDLQLKEVYKNLYGNYAKSFPALRPTLRNDRIYCRGVTIETAACLTGKPWKGLSDHVPLLAELTIGKKESHRVPNRD